MVVAAAQKAIPAVLCMEIVAISMVAVVLLQLIVGKAGEFE